MLQTPNCIIFLSNWKYKMKKLALQDEDSRNSIYRKLQDRVRKEARYSTINTITMRMTKSQKFNGLYKKSKKMAKNHGIKEQKNYYFSLLKIGLMITHLTEMEGYETTNAVDEIFNEINRKIKSTIQQKYKNQENYFEFLKMVEQKNIKDFQVLKSIYQRGSTNLKEVSRKLAQLHEKTHSKRHQSQRYKLAKILIDFKQNKQYQKMLNKKPKQNKKMQLEFNAQISEEEDVQQVITQQSQLSQKQIQSEKNGIYILRDINSFEFQHSIKDVMNSQDSVLLEKQTTLQQYQLQLQFVGRFLNLQ